MATTTLKQLKNGPNGLAVACEVPLWKLTIQQYHEMIEAGILTPEDRCELLDGILVRKMPIYPRHRWVSHALVELLTAMLPGSWYVDTQNPITLSGSEPEPDVFVVRGASADFFSRHPSPSDLALVVEVADTSVERDRDLKLPLYAADRIAQYWIVDLPAGIVEVCTEPFGTGETADYASRVKFAAGSIIPVVLDRKEIGQVAFDAFVR